MVKMHANEMQ